MKVFLSSRAFLILSFLWLSSIPLSAFFQNSTARVKTKYEFTDPRISEADTLLKKRQYKEALEAYEKAYDTYEAESFYEGMVYAKERMGRTYRGLGEDSLSKVTFQGAAALSREKLGSNHILESKAYLNNGIRAHRKLQYVDASKLLDSAIWVYGRTTYEDSTVLTDIVNFKFYAYFYSNLSADTLIHYLNERGRLLEESGSTRNQEVYLLSDYSRAFYKIGDYQKAVAYAIEASRVGREFRAEVSPFYYSDALFNLGRCLNEQGEFERALDVANELIDFTHEYDPKSSRLRGYYNLKAVILTGLERYSEAADEFIRIRQLLEERNSFTTFYRSTIMNLGVCYQLMEDYNKADYHLFESLRLEKEESNFPNSSLSPIYRHIGQYFESIDDHAKAIIYYDSAVRSNKLDYSNSILEFPENGSISPTYEVLNILKLKTLNFVKLYEADELLDSLELLNSSLMYVDSIHNYLLTNREKLQASQGKLFLSESFKSLYEAGLDASYHLYELGLDNEDKLSFLKTVMRLMSYGKSILFLEQSGELGGIQDSRLAEELKVDYFELKTKIEDLEQNFYRLIGQISTSDSLRTINSELLKLNSKLELMKSSIRETQGDLWSKNTVDANLFENITSITDQNSSKAFIEYFYGERHLYILAISKGTHSLTRVALDDEFGLSLEELKRHLSQKPKISGYEESLVAFKKNANSVFDKVLRDVLKKLGKDVNELIIVPDEQLSQLPFEALVISNDQPTDFYLDLDYVIKHYTINYALSASQIKTETSQRVASKRLFGIGYSGENNSELRSANSLGALPGTEDEIRFLENEIGGDHFLGLDGNKNRFLEYGRDYDILHLAVHGEANVTDRYQSSLIFNGEDGVLRTSDLYIANLNARLAILSACESGIGQINRGEGTFSIARGFALVGIPSVVMSLWKVNDRVASEIMVDFHRNLNNGEPVHQALRSAKANFLETADQYTSHPYYWSSFVSLGEGVVVKKSTDNRLIWFVALTVILISGVGVRYKKRKGVN